MSFAFGCDEDYQYDCGDGEYHYWHASSLSEEELRKERRRLREKEERSKPWLKVAYEDELRKAFLPQKPEASCLSFASGLDYLPYSLLLPYSSVVGCSLLLD